MFSPNSISSRLWLPMCELPGPYQALLCLVPIRESISSARGFFSWTSQRPLRSTLPSPEARWRTTGNPLGSAESASSHELIPLCKIQDSKIEVMLCSGRSPQSWNDEVIVLLKMS